MFSESEGESSIIIWSLPRPGPDFVPSKAEHDPNPKLAQVQLYIPGPDVKYLRKCDTKP